MNKRPEQRQSAQEAGYPRVYTIGGMRKIVQLGLAAAFAGGGLLFAWWIVNNFDTVRKDEAWFVPIIFAVLLILIGAGLASMTLQYRLILDADTISLAFPLGGWRIRRSDIAGRRAQTVVMNGIRFPYVYLIEKGERARKRRIFYVFKTDGVIENWLASLPDLDQRQHQEMVREVLENTEFGGTEEIRAARLERAGKIATYFNGGTALFAAGMLTILPSLAPDYYWWLIGALAALPFLAVGMVIASKGLLCIDGQEMQNKARPNLGAAFALAPVALAFRAWIDIDMIDWQRALEIGAVAGMAAGILALSARSKAASSPVMLLVFSLAWGSGATVFYNSGFDSTPPSVFPVRVLEMRKTTGKHASYHLKLPPWGPRSEPAEVETAAEFYAQVKKGGTVCVYLFNGALNVRWFEVSHCRE